MREFSLSTPLLRLKFQASEDRFWLSECTSGDVSYLNPASGLFSLQVNGQHYDTSNLSFRDFRLDATLDEVLHGIALFASADFELEYHVQVYPDSALLEQWQVIHSTGTTETLSLTRLDSFSLDIPPRGYELFAFTSDWGQEFEPIRQPITNTPFIIESRNGRSSKGHHPWFSLISEHGVLSGSVAWSGNWVCCFEPMTDGGCRLRGGLHDWNFAHDLAPGTSIETPHIVLALGRDLNDVSQQYTRVGRRFWYPRNELSTSLPVEWNHWWSYEDADINEAVFRANVEQAAHLGVELCTLDAGWFGPSDAETKWYEARGDWNLVNTDRFPGGIRALSDFVHANHMKFGLWCEIEALNEKADLLRTHPEFAARRDGVLLNQVCFGNPAVQEWAYQTLSRLIRGYNCDWIKLDYNNDPGAGCNRSDHGHGSGDGLYAHDQGYYAMLERLRHDFPEVVLENCSSGGLRIDLGMMRHTHLTFLSDPDWPVHDLQVFWGATTMLAPEACLHWSFSEWRGSHPQQTFNPRDPNLQPHQLDYYTRIAMLGAFGLSQKLPDLPDWVAERLAYHIGVYKDHVRRFVHAATLHKLTDQPRRSGKGERWCAFQYSLTDEHLLFVFRLPGAEAERSIRLLDLQPDRLYQIETLDGTRLDPLIGHQLMEQGIPFSNLQQEDSALLRLF